MKKLSVILLALLLCLCATACSSSKDAGYPGTVQGDQCIRITEEDSAVTTKTYYGFDTNGTVIDVAVVMVFKTESTAVTYYNGISARSDFSTCEISGSILYYRYTSDAVANTFSTVTKQGLIESCTESFNQYNFVYFDEQGKVLSSPAK